MAAAGTPSIVDELKSAGMDEPLARAVTHAITRSTTENVATKLDLAEAKINLRAEIAGVKTEIAGVKTELGYQRWVIGTVGVGVLLALLRSFQII